MSHNRKLGRTSDQRRAMLRAMVTYLLENGQIKTTVTRAKEVAPLAEKMITLAIKMTVFLPPLMPSTVSFKLSKFAFILS